MLVHVENLDYGPYLQVDMVARADGFLACLDEDTREAMEAQPLHPFTTLAHEKLMIYEDDVDLALSDFTLASDHVSCGVIVADNAVTRALIAGIRDPESLDTGNTTPDRYRADLVRSLMSLWD